MRRRERPRLIILKGEHIDSNPLQKHEVQHLNNIVKQIPTNLKLQVSLLPTERQPRQDNVLDT